MRNKTVRNKTVLLVEDNPDDEALTLRVFRQYNLACTVDVAHDGAEALDYLFREGRYTHRPSPDLPAVVLLDLKLPKLGGIEVLKRLRSDDRTRLVPVVVLTSSDGERDIAESYRNGANSYVRKPVNFGEFVAAVRDLGVYWLVHNESLS